MTFGLNKLANGTTGALTTVTPVTITGVTQTASAVQELTFQIDGRSGLSGDPIESITGGGGTWSKVSFYVQASPGGGSYVEEGVYLSVWTMQTASPTNGNLTVNGSSFAAGLAMNYTWREITGCATSSAVGASGMDNYDNEEGSEFSVPLTVAVGDLLRSIVGDAEEAGGTYWTDSTGTGTWTIVDTYETAGGPGSAYALATATNPDVVVQTGGSNFGVMIAYQIKQSTGGGVAADWIHDSEPNPSNHAKAISY